MKAISHKTESNINAVHLNPSNHNRFCITEKGNIFCECGENEYLSHGEFIQKHDNPDRLVWVWEDQFKDYRRTVWNCYERGIRFDPNRVTIAVNEHHTLPKFLYQSVTLPDGVQVTQFPDSYSEYREWANEIRRRFTL